MAINILTIFQRKIISLFQNLHSIYLGFFFHVWLILETIILKTYFDITKEIITLIKYYATSKPKHYVF